MSKKTKIRNGSDCYELLDEMGRGLHGVVYKAQMTGTSSQLVAVKKLMTASSSRLRTINVRVGREAEILRKLTADGQHRNIVRFLGEFRFEFEHFLVMEFVPFSLVDFIAAEKQNIAIFACHFLRMALNALLFLHSRNIMHRDLKPSNILLAAETLQVKLADFGSARLFFQESIASRVRYTAEVTSRWYRAPELLYGSRNYTRSIDFWSLGCVFAELLLSKPLFPGETDIEQLILIGKLFGSLSIKEWPECIKLPDYAKIEFGQLQETSLARLLSDFEPSLIQLTAKLLSYDPTKRFEAQQILEERIVLVEPDCRQIDDVVRAISYLKTRTKADR